MRMWNGPAIDIDACTTSNLILTVIPSDWDHRKGCLRDQQWLQCPGLTLTFFTITLSEQPSKEVYSVYVTLCSLATLNQHVESECRAGDHVNGLRTSSLISSCGILT